METTQNFEFNYLDLVTALGSFQTDNPDDSIELTKEILGFFQSKHAQNLMSLNTETPSLNLKPIPVKPLLQKFLATLHIYDKDEGKIAEVSREIKAKTLQEAETIINQDLKLGDWSTVEAIGN